MKDSITYEFMVNGFPVQATFSHRSLNEIFIPLVRRLTNLQKEKQQRLIVYLAAPPAVGKSTLACLIQKLSQELADATEIQAVGMDGFHFPQQYLKEHTAVINGKEVPMVDVKGCPETFDIKKFTTAIRRLQSEHIKWPLYDRNLHDVVEDQILVNQDIVLIEGNWLLLQESLWTCLEALCDYRIFIHASEDMLEKRLIERKQRGGYSLAEATEFYHRSDRKNIERVLQHSSGADLLLRLREDQEYETEGGL